jgi:hypothetical protein
MGHARVLKAIDTAIDLGYNPIKVSGDPWGVHSWVGTWGRLMRVLIVAEERSRG